MDREEAIRILNANIQKFDLASVSKFLVEFLTEKNIELDRVQLFIKTISEEPIHKLNNTLGQCLEYSIDYYVRKFGINSIRIKPNSLTPTVQSFRIIYYF